MALLAVTALFFVLISVNLDETDLPAGRKFKMVGLTLLKAVPLTAVLFVLFPRISGPLWGTPGDAGAGNTGLSNSMSPGTISQLLESTEIAFRVKFDGARRVTTSFTGAVRCSARSMVARGCRCSNG